MGKRGTNAFRRNDAIRALQSARDAGLDPSALDVIIAPDGTTTFRVYGDKAAPEKAKEVMAAAEWDAEIEKLKKAKTKDR
jgi:hypothetical protein